MQDTLSIVARALKPSARASKGILHTRVSCIQCSQIYDSSVQSHLNSCLFGALMLSLTSKKNLIVNKNEVRTMCPQMSINCIMMVLYHHIHELVFKCMLLTLYTRYPIVARALGLAAVQPLGRVRARAKVSCIQLLTIHSRKVKMCPYLKIK